LINLIVPALNHAVRIIQNVWIPNRSANGPSKGYWECANRTEINELSAIELGLSIPVYKEPQCTFVRLIATNLYLLSNLS
jgi:hypothetical protein